CVHRARGRTIPAQRCIDRSSRRKSNRNIQKLSTAETGGRDTPDCVCGGTVSQGQRTGLVLTSGRLAISASSEILSSFSGVLLYPTVGKR
ncbi:hypothetical protein M9458_014809, partial [Cirrhinus mrigala]